MANSKLRLLKTICLFFFISLMLSCKEDSNKIDKLGNASPTKITEFNPQLRDVLFDTIINKKHVQLFWLKNDHIKLAITNYGGRFVGLWVMDKEEHYVDVVVGFNSVADYIKSTEPYFGATIGRVGNRIANGKFEVNGNTYQTSINNGANALHGGKKGFQDVAWDAQQINDSTLILSYISPDMQEGFPGNLQTKVTYSIDANAIKMAYEASTDQPTIVNLTNHAFFNLNGEGSGSILNHRLEIYAEKFTPIDAGLIPTGKLEPVENTPFDFRTSHTIGERIAIENDQLKNGAGYDHNYVLNSFNNKTLTHAARVVGDKSGIQMDVYTQEPGLQFYSGNFMQSLNTFKSGAKDDYRSAFCLETQHFPDAPNQPNFPSIVLKPEDTYRTNSEYRFTIESNNKDSH